ncbi:pentatricopeptide repeat-containing protein At5g59600 [Rhodamnia argentea]|uniref:Pentatricopeptide repeat-containing protein At5g59600 n=1 Tax=Rhodamnia argentea TaxID=178133 RepID=A0ABM3HVG6_9MYRT|nr:pentatricopeptide repeat-containing protein At5g59600 [Rhodamnia argentea]
MSFSFFTKCPVREENLRGIPSINRSYHSSFDACAELIDACARNRALRSGKALHAHLIVTGLCTTAHIASKVIGFYTDCGSTVDARRVFDEIPESDVRRWTVLLGAFARRGYHQEALDLFLEMRREGMEPNSFVFPSILKVCGQLSDRRAGENVHVLVLKLSVEDDLFINSALIDMYSKCGHIKKARTVFDMMVGKDLVTFNAMVSGYAQNGFAKEAIGLVENMKFWGLKPDVVTWNTLISGFSQKGDPLAVRDLLKSMSFAGIEPDVVSWTSVISGLVQSSKNEDAFKTFKEMMACRIYPNSATISSLLPACATSANLRLGKEMHGYAVVLGVENDIFVRSALLDMYAKCGLITEAKLLFSDMSEKNAVSWNSMIFGLASHGYCNEAIETFTQMEKEDSKSVDHLTFTAALTACSHGGMIELGKSLFHKMQEAYKIEPRLEHYACIVDLLGRAGKLSEAYVFIEAMPVEPDLFVWGALLGACRNHGNLELAEVAARHLSKLEPGNAGNSMLLSELYANASNNWNARLRMKRRKLIKFLGSSWIESV